jgi:signal transduction histidine kinase
MSNRSRVWVLGACALVFAQALASLVMRPGFGLIALSDVTQCILLLSGTLAFLPNVFATRGRPRLFWALMMLGVAFWFSYQLFWTYFEVYLRQDVPNPFVGDVVLFLHIVPMMAALALQPHVKQYERATRLGTLDFSLLLVFWIYLWLLAVIPWQYIETNETFYSHNLNSSYLTEKLVFLGGLALLWTRSSGTWKRIYAQIFGASLLYALSSYFANWAIARKVYYSGSLYDVPLAASMAWFTVAGLFALDADAVPETRKAPESYGAWVARLGMITVFCLPVFAVWSISDSSVPTSVRTYRLTVSLATMLVMGVMVFVKQRLLDLELMRLLRTSRESYDDLQQLQTQLIQSEKLASLGQLVGGAAHELNNPLTAMLGYSDLLASTPLTPDQQALAEKIAAQVRRTKGLVASLLSFAKQSPAEKSLEDMNAVVQTAMKLSGPQLSMRNITGKMELAPHLPPVAGDSNQLLQVCLHIINNAMHAMSERGGVLRIVSRYEGDYIRLEFSDTGPGIPDTDRVFDPFYTTRPIGKGTGLGLSACYGIIQAHGGTISGENGAEGGAVFRIALPQADKAAPSFTPAKSKPGDSSPAQLKSPLAVAATKSS